MKLTIKTSSSGAFDGVRLAAALLVVYGHSFALTGQSAAAPLVRFPQASFGLAEIAVYIFFAISGYLVTQSWMRDPSVLRFMARRALRILPGLAFVILGSVFVVGLLMAKIPLSDYFSRGETWRYLAKMLVYPAQYGLPGVFEANPYPSVVNGSLWSLRVEFTLYGLVAFLGALGALRWRWAGLVLALGCLAMNVVLTQTAWFASVAFLHQGVVFFSNAVPFFMGAVLARSDLGAKPVWGLVVVSLLLVTTPLFQSLLLVVLPVVTILVGRYGRCDLSRFGDFSNGLYLWGFVVQQMIVAVWGGIGPTALFFLASAGALLMAALSWHFIEKPALGLKPRAKVFSG